MPRQLGKGQVLHTFFRSLNFHNHFDLNYSQVNEIYDPLPSDMEKIVFFWVAQDQKTTLWAWQLWLVVHNRSWGVNKSISIMEKNCLLLSCSRPEDHTILLRLILGTRKICVFWKQCILSYYVGTSKNLKNSVSSSFCIHFILQNQCTSNFWN